MWITVKNLLMVLAIVLLFVFTAIGMRAYAQERRCWKNIEAKACHSHIDEFDG